MAGTEFQIDFRLIGLLFLCAPLFYLMLRRRQKFAEPSLGFSLAASLPIRSGKGKWARLPEVLLWSAFSLFLLALPDPRLLIDLKNENHFPSNAPPPTEGIAIYLILDQSGSMTEKVFSSDFSRGTISKIDLVKEMTRKFILGDPKAGLQGRQNDLMGLIFFARAAHIEAPLTLDHGALLQQLNGYDHVKNKKEDGTAIGYAIYKAANLIAATRHFTENMIKKGKPAYTIKNSIMILLTDGMQDPNPLDKGKRLRNMDIPEAAEYANNEKIRLYVINVEPKLATEQFAPWRHIMQRASEMTGGKYYMMDGSKSLAEIYHEIDSIEKSFFSIPSQITDKNQRPDLYRRLVFAPYLIAVGLACLLTSVMAEAFWLRRVP